MEQSIMKYVKDFWSAEKVLLAFFLGIFTCIHFFQREFYQVYCFTGEGIRNSPCYGFILDYVYTPLATADSAVIIFIILLLLLPLSLLHTWFKRIAIWSIPAGLFLFSLITPPSQNISSGIRPGTTPASFLEFVVQLWIVLLVGFVVYHIGQNLYHRFYSKTEVKQ
jgi:hypothetical protein